MKIHIDTDEMKRKLNKHKQVLAQQIKEEKRQTSFAGITNPDRNDLAADYASRARQISLLQQLKNSG